MNVGNSHERAVHITQEEVDDWCEQNADSNPLHDSDAAEDEVFGESIVPGMMLLDKLSGLLNSLSDETVILTGLTVVRFRDPVLMDETVTFTAEVVEETPNYHSIDFRARVESRGSLVAHGTVTATTA